MSTIEYTEIRSYVAWQRLGIFSQGNYCFLHTRVATQNVKMKFWLSFCRVDILHSALFCQKKPDQGCKVDRLHHENATKMNLFFSPSENIFLA